MLIVRGRNIPVSAMLREHSRKRIGRALRRSRHEVEHVALIFVDLDGPRGGARQAACRVLVALIGGGRVTVESRAQDFYAAASAAAKLAGRVVASELVRLRRPVATVGVARAAATLH